MTEPAPKGGHRFVCHHGAVTVHVPVTSAFCTRCRRVIDVVAADQDDALSA